MVGLKPQGCLKLKGGGEPLKAIFNITAQMTRQVAPTLLNELIDLSHIYAYAPGGLLRSRVSKLNSAIHLKHGVEFERRTARVVAVSTPQADGSGL